MLCFDIVTTPEADPFHRLLAMVAPAVVLGLVAGAPSASAAPGSPDRTVEQARSLLEAGREEKAARVIRNARGLDSGDSAVTEALRDLLEEARTAIRTADRPKRADGARILLCTVRYRLGVAEATADGNGIGLAANHLRRWDDPELEPMERLYSPMPDFAGAALRLRHEAAVVTQLIIDQEGCVTSIKPLVDADYELDAAYGLVDRTVETLATWVFRPALLDDQPVAVYHTLTTSFRLQ